MGEKWFTRRCWEFQRLEAGCIFKDDTLPSFCYSLSPSCSLTQHTNTQNALRLSQSRRADDSCAVSRSLCQISLPSHHRLPLPDSSAYVCSIRASSSCLFMGLTCSSFRAHSYTFPFPLFLPLPIIFKPISSPVSCCLLIIPFNLCKKCIVHILYTLILQNATTQQLHC